jgi:diguanylate cyclase (GGDEF)-like protein/PAS domain S-box-containing protein
MFGERQSKFSGWVPIRRTVGRRHSKSDLRSVAGLAAQSAQRLTSIGSFESDFSGRTTWSNELYRIFGLDPGELPASYETWRSCVHRDDRELLDVVVRRAYEDHKPYTLVHRVVRPDGQVRTVESHGRVELDRAGKPVKIVGTCQDITALKLAEEHFRALLETAPDAMVIIDEDVRIVLVNSQTERLFGYERHELIGNRVSMLVPDSSAARAVQWADFAFDPRARPMGSGLDLGARRKDGSGFPVEITLSPLRTDEGMLVCAAIRDVTERKLAADALAHQARHDPLTGLPNRTLFLDRLEHALARARRSGAKLAVLFLDLDDFKLVNDTLGHDAGDLLLVALTPRLLAALRPGDTIARFGGDEFVVLCEDLVAEADAVHIAERVAAACAQPITIGGHERLLTVSSGAVIVEGGDATPADLLRDADAAMYRAKARGKGRVEVFDEGMRTRLIDRIAIESQLRSALRRGELRLFYQPVVELSSERAEVVAVEALLRWQHPERGLLVPADFIEIAEASGLIVPIGEWVIEEACRQAAAWRDGRPGKPPIRVSVNLSPRQVDRSDVASSRVSSSGPDSTRACSTWR